MSLTNKSNSNDMNYYEKVVGRMTDLFLDKQFTIAKREINKVIEEVVLHDVSKDAAGLIQHICYTLLGLMAFEEKDFDSARTYLLRSITDLESPVLKTFGPSVLLAHQLSSQGDIKIVEEYLARCKEVVEMENLFKLSEWITSAQNGDQPDFGKIIYLHLGVNDDIRKRLVEYAPL